MSELAPFEALSLRWLAPDGEEAAMSAEALARALTGLQRAVHSLAAEALRAAGVADVRPSAAFRRRYELRVLSRLDACGRMPLSIGPRQLELDLALGVSPQELAERLVGLWGAIARREAAPLEAAFPEPAGRVRFASEVLKALPRPKERGGLALAGPSGEGAVLDATHAAFLTALGGGTPVARGAVAMTIAAEVLGVDFVTGSFSVRYAPTGRVLSGRYAPEQEVWLLKQRRKPIRLSGLFALDADDQPHALKDVTGLAPLDLAPVRLEGLDHQDRWIAIVPPLELTPELEADGQLGLADPGLGLEVRAESREALVAALERRVRELLESFDGQTASPLLAAWRRRLQVPQEAG